MNKKEFSTLEIVVAVFSALTLDILDILLDLVGVGLVIDTIIGIIDFIMFRLWFRYKGANLKLLTGMGSMEWLPLINVMPFTTLAVIMTIRTHNQEVEHDKQISSAAMKASAMAKAGGRPMGTGA